MPIDNLGGSKFETYSSHPHICENSAADLLITKSYQCIKNTNFMLIPNYILFSKNNNNNDGSGKRIINLPVSAEALLATNGKETAERNI